MRLLSRVGDVLEALEVSVILLLGTALCAGLVVGIPVVLVWELFTHGRPLLAGLVVALVVLMAISVARDLRARRLSWVSAGLAALWILCTGYVGIRLLLE